MIPLMQDPWSSQTHGSRVEWGSPAAAVGGMWMFEGDGFGSAR